MIRQENQLQIHLIFATKRGQFYHTDAAQPASRRRLYTFVATFVGGFVGGFCSCSLFSRFAWLYVAVSLCNPNPCQQKALCFEDVYSQSFMCICPPGYRGKLCNICNYTCTVHSKPRSPDPQLDLRGPTSKGGRVTFQVSRSNKPEVEIRRKR